MVEEFPNIKELLETGIEQFKEEFTCLPTVIGIAPGRVNLIGDHTDYNEGFVSPMALPMVTAVIGKKTDTNICRVKTAHCDADEPRLVTFELPSENVLKPGEPLWANYVKGVVQFSEVEKSGFDAVIVTSVPFGSGLSSSAALEVSVYTFLETICDKTSDPLTKAKICQKAEHEYANVPCGLMDQLISVYGQKGCVSFIDCQTNKVENIRVQSTHVVFLIINSMVKHELSMSEYPIRKATCETICEKIKKKSLRNVEMDDLQKMKESGVINEVEFRRARHVIRENERTVQAAEALRADDVAKFGFLMNESHMSLRDDFEVSCKEIDLLVEITRKVSGVYGSRMTGGGFGGCTVTLVKDKSVEEVIREVKNKYTHPVEFYVVTPSQGAIGLTLEKATQVYTLDY